MKTVDEIKTVAGIGGGVIGGSWAVLFAMKGYDVNLYDINDECIANDKKTIEGNLSFLVENGAIADAASVEAVSYTHLSSLAPPAASAMPLPAPWPPMALRLSSPAGNRSSATQSPRRSRPPAVRPWAWPPTSPAPPLGRT